jgi:hypothetical protein
MGNQEEISTEDSADKTSSEATSKKTLEDIEETQKDSSTHSDDHTSTPAPDGQLDEERSERDDVGPM